MSEACMAAKDGRLTVYLTGSIKKKFKVLAAKRGKSQTALVEELIADLVRDEPDVYENGGKPRENQAH